jgi:hypothetical protein
MVAKPGRVLGGIEQVKSEPSSSCYLSFNKRSIVPQETQVTGYCKVLELEQVFEA